MYSLVYSDLSLKQLKKIDKETQNRLVSSLERSRMRPYHFVTKLVGNPYYRLRVGDYRVILDIQNDKLIIFVIELRHRKDIYQ